MQKNKSMDICLIHILRKKVQSFFLIIITKIWSMSCVKWKNTDYIFVGKYEKGGGIESVRPRIYLSFNIILSITKSSYV